MKDILKTRIRASVCIFACIAIGFTCALKPFFKGIIIDGNSMAPTYQNNAWVLMYKKSYLGKEWVPHRGDVVIVLFAGESMCKRVIGLPGDTIDIVDGRIYINQSKVPDGYASGQILFIYESQPTEWETNILETTMVIPDGYVWLIGDNREESWYGSILIRDITGRVITW